MGCTTFTNVFLRPKSVLMSIFKYLRHIKPKTLSLGPKNTRSNFLSIPDISQFTVYYSAIYYCALIAYATVSAFKFFLHIFLAFYSNFCIKSYKRVCWSFPPQEPILVPSFVSESFQPVCTNNLSNSV